MEFSAKIEPQDYVQAQFLHLRPRPALMVIGILLVILLVFAFAFALFRYIETGKEWQPVLFFGAFITYYTAWFFYLLPKRARRTYRQTKLLQETAVLRMDDEKINIKTSFGDSTLPWTTFCKWKENGTIFLVYQSDNLFHIFPKRYFPSREGIDECRSILQKQVGNAKA